MVWGDGRYVKMLATLAKTDLLILDDYDLITLTTDQRHDSNSHSEHTIEITSNAPVQI